MMSYDRIFYGWFQIQVLYAIRSNVHHLKGRILTENEYGESTIKGGRKSD